MGTRQTLKLQPASASNSASITCLRCASSSFCSAMADSSLKHPPKPRTVWNFSPVRLSCAAPSNACACFSTHCASGALVTYFIRRNLLILDSAFIIHEKPVGWKNIPAFARRNGDGKCRRRDSAHPGGWRWTDTSSVAAATASRSAPCFPFRKARCFGRLIPHKQSTGLFMEKRSASRASPLRVNPQGEAWGSQLCCFCKTICGYRSETYCASASAISKWPGSCCVCST